MNICICILCARSVDLTTDYHWNVDHTTWTCPYCGTVHYISKTDVGLNGYTNKELKQINNELNIDPSKGIKNDTAKPDLSLIPLETFGPIARAFEEGNSRPGRTRDGWKNVPDYENYFTAKILRHLAERRAGKLKDDGSGQNPIAHLIADAMGFLWHDLKDGRKS